MRDTQRTDNPHPTRGNRRHYLALALSALIAAGAYLGGSTLFAQSALPDGSLMAMSQHSFSDTLTALTRAVETENLMVIETVDGQRMLRMAGLSVPGMTQVFYFHPRFMRRVLEADPMAAMQIPLKFIVMERPDGNVVVRYFKPSTVLGPYNGQAEIAAELDGLVDTIVTSATK